MNPDLDRPGNTDRNPFANQRVGVVMAGGGAKGAYQLGCLRALREAGVTHLDALAGTSVGAAHAVMLATDKLDAAEDIWRGLRIRDVVRVAVERLHRLPLWMIAGFNSEFAPFSVWRWGDTATHPQRWRHHAYLVACLASAGLIVWLATLAPALAWAAWTLAAALVAAAVVGALHEWMRPRFLNSTFLSLSPIANLITHSITEEDWARARAKQIPIYGTVSRHQPFATEGVPWAGWVPRYIRLDTMSRADMLATITAGLSLPGFSDPHELDGSMVVDGAWTDNAPAAPLLFDGNHELDVLFVLHLKQVVRYRRRHNSLVGVGHVLLTDLLSGRSVGPADLIQWARSRWRASGGTVTDHASPTLPRVVLVAPSERVGNFFSGTLFFSKSRAARLIDLGRRDMENALAAFQGRTADPEGSATADRLRKRRGTLVAESAQARS